MTYITITKEKLLLALEALIHASAPNSERVKPQLRRQLASGIKALEDALQPTNGNQPVLTPLNDMQLANARAIESSVGIGPWCASDNFVRGPSRPSGSGFKEIVIELPSREKAVMTATNLNEFFTNKIPTDAQIDAVFDAYASRFDTFGDEWQDMGAGDYFKAGFKAAINAKEVA